MRVYFGGADAPNALTTLGDAGGTRIMLSFGRVPTDTGWQIIRSYGFEIMLDSGAFSAWMQGMRINLDDYMQYIRQHGITHYFNLDVVGDHKASAVNQRAMECRGLHPIPVFHFSQLWIVLDGMVEQYPLVGLGGTVGQPHTAKRRWFEQVFTRHPSARFHGLGVSDRRLLRQFPFASTDSTWWLYKFRDNQCRMAPGTCRKAEQRARIKYLLRMEGADRAYQQALNW